MPDEDRFVMAIAFKAGRDDRIKKGADGRRDFAEAEVIEKAAWGYLRKGRQIGIEHADGTLGHAEVVESHIHRGPDWVIKSVSGKAVTVSEGDWVIGMLLDPLSWAARKAGKLNGVSPQGKAARRRKDMP